MFTTYYFSSLKNAKLELAQVLEINRAKDVKRDDVWVSQCDYFIDFVDYVGEEGRYKGRVILERHKLNQ